MSAFDSKDRFLRVLPGRIRMEICGLQGNKRTAELLINKFAPLNGIHKIVPCPDSGRLLLVFDEKRVQLRDIFQMIRSFETELLEKCANFAEVHTEEVLREADREELKHEVDPEYVARKAQSEELKHEVISEESQHELGTEHVVQAEYVRAEVAVTSETSTPITEMPEGIKSLPVMPKPEIKRIEKVPLPLALSMGGLAVLGLKQLFMGQSALARSPAPFYLSALVSVVTGYPFLRRGFQKYSRNYKWNSDLILGGSALALALLRENLVVLAGMSILQYVNWQRTQSSLDPHQNVRLPTEIRTYSEKASTMGMVAAATTWVFTRNPLRAIAVLLATNPRPATIPAECAWNQAELVCKQRNYTVPEKGMLYELAQTKTILVEDSSLLFDQNIQEVECIRSEDDVDKVICLAASLMEKSNHPWKEEVWDKAKQTCRTIRTAFHVEEEDQGIKGKINDSRVLIGTIKYMQKYGVACDQHMLEAKRLERKGFGVLFVAKQVKNLDQCVGLLVKRRHFSATNFGKNLSSLVEKGWNIGMLRNGLQVEPSAFAQLGINAAWLSVEEGEIIERIAIMRQQGKPVLLVTSDERNGLNQCLKEAGIPSIAVNQFGNLLETVEYAEQIDQTVSQHFHITKRWNVLGSALATVGVLSAPVVNLAADALSLIFLSRTKRISELTRTDHLPDTVQEVAAASENITWHAVPWETITSHYDVKQHVGLSSDQAHSLRNQYGVNQLERKKPTPWVVSYLGQFKEFTTLILLGTSVLAFFTGGFFDGVAMGTVLLANAAIGTMQERKAEKVVESLNQFQPPLCRATRDGQQSELSATQLVPGDVVCLEAGDRVPADIRLIRGWNLQVNEGALTGESIPVAKQESAIAEQSPLSERSNMLYMGTDVCRGKGVGVVVQTGMGTEMGHLMSLMKQEHKEITPLQQKVSSISKKFIKGACLVGGLVFLTGLLRGIPVTQMMTTSITLAASAIPEGLPITITIALSAGVFRMAKKNALVRKLSSLETLGRTTVICTDKTGTLTKNEMTVKSIATVNKLWTVTGNGYEPIGAIQEIADEVAVTSAVLEQKKSRDVSSHDHPELQRILQIGMLCNNSKLEQLNERWMVKGDPTEGALLSLAVKTGLSSDKISKWHRCFEIPFDSNTRKMSVVCQDTEPGKDCFVFSKGAVETILRECNRYQANGEVLPLTEDQKQLIYQQNEKLSADALRVLAFAYRPTEFNKYDNGINDKEMIYVGMVGMMDPPKADVKKSIQEAYALGVKPVMITGDHPITAIAIAKRLGIYDETQRVLTGHELDRFSDEQLFETVEDVSIFARVSPEHKLRIVTAFQKKGHIVAMTGDGVNDTPAIKQANVGIAMGGTGTEVTKETADMVLKEDHFGTIVDGVKEGRTIMGNIRKALGCLLTGNLAEIIVTSAAVIAGLPIPLVPIQILLMNLLTDALPAMILAVNPGDNNKQTEKIDIVDKELYQKVITRGLLLGAGSLGLFAVSMASGVPIGVAQTIAFATLVAGQLIQTFSWRQEGSDETLRDWTKDRFLIGALGVSWLALFAAIYVPPLAAFFHTAPLSLHHWLPILVVAGSVTFFSKPILSLVSRKWGKPNLAPTIQIASAA